ncbi:hypothetical protein [Chitinophaga pinensis]|uniref:ASCH domain-containing protein n=1 Tax=Chitinophaga pinensis (strain ATCC 43595 / DSM 2588 / LMG 13176 / NBRC 15968 / NCIMB 11800 / UQM 2034) TaxID=485918 RepID=A0A979GSA7_CHIPD|nr:hypothetical protein [Chitinophaga pinensis]ACU61293.1 conserved hypothetical protein [Chitinophaga pinensis DSM 2588]
MNKKPILFSAPMVQAILEGRKTVTRRIIKPRTPEDITRLMYMEEGIRPEEMKEEHIRCSCPYGRIGDILWVRESFNKTPDFGYAYNASQTNMGEEVRQEYLKAGQKWAKWKPSIHMPYDACRLFLKITDIRVERLQDITEDQAKAEGIEPLLMSGAQKAECGQLYRDYTKKPGLFNEGLRPIESFRSLWISINGEDNYNANPFVWAVSFERTEKPQ